MRKYLFALFAVLLPHVVSAQTTFSGPPNDVDYEYWCGNYGTKGAKSRNQCEGRLRLNRGVATCDDIVWTYSCKIDSMTDSKNCSAYVEGSKLFVFAQNGHLAFGVTGNSYPGTQSWIRIDSNPAISFDDNSGTTRAQDLAIENQLHTGKIVKTRHIQWPSGIASNDETPICNLPDVMYGMKEASK